MMALIGEFFSMKPGELIHLLDVAMYVVVFGAVWLGLGVARDIK